MKKRLCFCFWIIWMVLIFLFSNESGIDSSRTSGFFVQIIEKYFLFIPIPILTFLLRKCAHMFLYFILSILTFYVMKNKPKHAWVTILFCLFYACTDEIHQIFVMGRSGCIQDVWIDMIGVMIGMFLIYFIKRIRKKIA